MAVSPLAFACAGGAAPALVTGFARPKSVNNFTLQIRAFRISLPSYNVACLSLTPHLSGVWAVVSGPEPLQRFYPPP